MPVDFDGSADFIQFADNAIYDNLALKSMFLRTTIDGDGTDVTPRLLWKTPAAATTGWSFYYNSTNDRFEFTQTGSGDDGIWHTTSSSATIGNTYSVGFSMDIGNINNDGIVYLDGVADSTESLGATGAFETDAGDGLFVGYAGGSADLGFYEGKIWDIHLSNVIWTAAEFASLHASNAPGYWMRGLIFYPQMNGAAGLQAFDGAALGGGNTIVDIISGIIGTPTSNPLGVADTVLAV